MKRASNILKIVLVGIMCCISANQSHAQDLNVKKVYTVFKTHLDIGFTDLSSKVEQRYIDDFIPKAINVAEELKAEGGEARYVWTTGAWLIDAYLRQAEPEAVQRLEKAIREGDIVWNAMPYTVESESLNGDMFSAILKLSDRLDRRFGKHTIAAKMTDVPGHTRSIVSLLCGNGIRFLHIGVNSAATVPDVPPICRWKAPDGNEIILMYQKTYGEDMILPGGESALSINFTNDNHGPHTVQKVKDIYTSLHKRYPNAEIVATSLNDVVQELENKRNEIPVLTSEIGDTWIYGYGSSPVRMAKFRALCRLYSRWIKEGKIDPDSDIAVDYAIRLGMIAEHTWGADVKVFLKNWDKYDYDSFSKSRNDSSFRFMEESWKELDENIPLAINLLPDDLRTEAEDVVSGIGTSPEIPQVSKSGRRPKAIDGSGYFSLSANGTSCRFGGISYQTFSSEDYKKFHDAYLRRKIQWAFEDNGKPGLENTGTQSAMLEGSLAAISHSKSQARCMINFPDNDAIDKRVLPEAVETEYKVSKDGRKVDLTVTIVNKPANRMPEAYWISFLPEGFTGVIAEKTGSAVDLMDVVEGGNRQMHGIDRYVDLITTNGTIRVTSYDALLLSVGEKSALNFSRELPDLSKGVHFCLYNNLWGTNFSMWWSGSVQYRFIIEIL